MENQSHNTPETVTVEVLEALVSRMKETGQTSINIDRITERTKSNFIRLSYEGVPEMLYSLIFNIESPHLIEGIKYEWDYAGKYWRMWNASFQNSTVIKIFTPSPEFNYITLIEQELKGVTEDITKSCIHSLKDFVEVRYAPKLKKLKEFTISPLKEDSIGTYITTTNLVGVMNHLSDIGADRLYFKYNESHIDEEVEYELRSCQYVPETDQEYSKAISLRIKPTE